MLLPARELRDQVRVRDVGAGHADHVDASLLHRAVRRRQIRHPVRVEHGEAERVADAFHPLDVWRDGVGHVGHGEAQARVVEGGTHGDVQEVDEPGVDVQAHDLHGVVLVQSVLHQLVHGEAHADQEPIRGALAHRLQRLQREPGAVGGAPSVAVGAPIHRRRPELPAEVPENRELAAVEPSPLRAARRGSEVADDAVDVVAVHGPREGAVRRLAHRRRRDGREPAVRAPAGAPPHVGDLDHRGAAVAVDSFRERLEPRDDAVLAEIDLPERRRRVDRHRRGAAEHGEREPAFRFLLVVAPVALLRHAVLGVGGGVRGAHDPVLQPDMADDEGFEEGGVGRCHRARLRQVAGCGPRARIIADSGGCRAIGGRAAPPVHARGAARVRGVQSRDRTDPGAENE